MEYELKIDEMIKQLEKREKEQDALLPETRILIRHVSNGIKLMHAGEVDRAKEELNKAEGLMKKLQERSDELERLLYQSYQEVVEGKVLFAIIDREKVPTYDELGVPFESYLSGLCDTIGELRREMLESLKNNKIDNAQYYFDAMSEIYEQLIPIRFSNSILPNFRKKQDVARSQVERARSELLRYTK